MHIKFISAKRTYIVPVATLEIESFLNDYGTMSCWVHGHSVDEETYASAELALERQHHLPALGVWDCSKLNGGARWDE